jgi:hypothetical protein
VQRIFEVRRTYAVGDLSSQDHERHSASSATTVEAKDGYLFPLWHGIGQAAQPIVGSRYWTAVVLVIAVLQYVPFLFSGFSIEDQGFRIQFAQEVRDKVDLLDNSLRSRPPSSHGFSTVREAAVR